MEDKLVIAKAVAVLSACEGKLRTLLAEAASAGDYDAVTRIAGWAREVAELASVPVVPVVPLQTPSAARSERTPKGPPEKRTTEYPRFARTEDALVKIGWSKADRAEYQHKAPLSILPVLVAALAAKGKGGRVFPLERLMPLRVEEGDVPGYQVYVWLAWLREAGLVEQKGRQGYTVADPAKLAGAAEDLWRATPLI